MTATTSRSRPGGGSLYFVAPAAIFVVVSLIAPLAIMFRYSLNDFTPADFMIEAFTLKNYISLVYDNYYRGILWQTVRVAFTVTLICLVVGFPLAYVLSRTRSRFKNLLLIAIVLPLFVGTAVRSAGWMVALGNGGLLNWVLLSLGIIQAPLTVMYTPVAVIMGITSVNLPFVVLSLQSVIEGIDRSVEEAAFNLGASPSRMMAHVLLPLAMPGILTGGVFCFILGMNAYATPLLLGGPTFQMMAQAVYSQFILENNWPLGAALAFLLLSTTIVLSTSVSLFAGRSRRRASA